MYTHSRYGNKCPSWTGIIGKIFHRSALGHYIATNVTVCKYTAM